uniref:SAM domain-containing protein n=1 Tax=Cairina moschata TaxID=8855 RepID=A0A8C3CGT5_CAIMO
RAAASSACFACGLLSLRSRTPEEFPRTRSRCSIPFAGAMLRPSLCFVSEIEAKKACDWLRAAGFPQYAQLYEDSLFPLDIGAVKKDHSFLDQDSLKSLCRRLMTLNTCASMKLEVHFQRKQVRLGLPTGLHLPPPRLLQLPGQPGERVRQRA